MLVSAHEDARRLLHGSVSAQMVNQLLAERGLQTKGETGWSPTAAGAKRSAPTTVTGPERALITMTVWQPAVADDLVASATRQR